MPLHIWGYWYFSWQSWFQLVFIPVQRFSWYTLHISSLSRVTIYSLEVLLFLFGTSLLFHAQFWPLLPDLHIGFSRGRSGGLVFPSLSKFSTVYCDPHSQSLWHSQYIKNICFFWNSLAFSIIQRMLATWSLIPLPFLKSAWTSGSSRFTYCWSLAWRILSITFVD